MWICRWADKRNKENFRNRRTNEFMTVEELMKYMLNLFNNTSDNLHKEYEKLSQKDMELSDLDHYIENHRFQSYA